MSAPDGPARLWWNDYTLPDCPVCGDPCSPAPPAQLLAGDWAHRCCVKVLAASDPSEVLPLRCPSCSTSKGFWRGQARPFEDRSTVSTPEPLS